jgi:hypothetical protein
MQNPNSYPKLRRELDGVVFWLLHMKFAGIRRKNVHISRKNMSTRSRCRNLSSKNFYLQFSNSTIEIWEILSYSKWGLELRPSVHCPAWARRIQQNPVFLGVAPWTVVCALRLPTKKPLWRGSASARSPSSPTPSPRDHDPSTQQTAASPSPPPAVASRDSHSPATSSR